MDYQTAIATVKAGTPVRRQSWETSKRIELIPQNNSYIIGTHRTIVADIPYTATQEDMFANDWTT